jgi:hypothetical protein
MIFGGVRRIASSLPLEPEVGELLGLHRVHFEIFGLGVLADDHAS